MQRKLLSASVAAAMLLVASSAFAVQGINLSWNDCAGEGTTGAQNKNFACGANTGTNILVTSWIMDADLPSVSGNELVLDVLTTSNPMPSWWIFRDVGSCRQNAMGTNTTINAADVVCLDWAEGQSAGGIGAYSQELGTIDGSLLNQHRRIKIAIAVPLPLKDLVMNQEYFSTNITINNTKTVGTGACAGCTEPVCIVFNSINITRPVGVGDLKIGNAASAGSNICTWQGSGPNCLSVPVRNVTWGSVKSLYR